MIYRQSDKLQALNQLGEKSYKNISFGAVSNGKEEINELTMYVAIDQWFVEEDEEKQIMSLKSASNSAKIFKVDEKDASYIEFEQILLVLPNPDIEHVRNTLYYEFLRDF